MGFEDLAKRMRPGGGADLGRAGTVDPDQIMADAQRAAARSERISDLVLGPLLLIGGVVLVVFWYSLTRQRGAIARNPQLMAEEDPIRMLGPFVHALFAGAFLGIIAGGRKILRGIGVWKR